MPHSYSVLFSLQTHFNNNIENNFFLDIFQQKNIKNGSQFELFSWVLDANNENNNNNNNVSSDWVEEGKEIVVCNWNEKGKKKV